MSLTHYWYRQAVTIGGVGMSTLPGGLGNGFIIGTDTSAPADNSTVSRVLLDCGFGIRNPGNIGVDDTEWAYQNFYGVGVQVRSPSTAGPGNLFDTNDPTLVLSGALTPGLVQPGVGTGPSSYSWVTQVTLESKGQRKSDVPGTPPYVQVMMSGLNGSPFLSPILDYPLDWRAWYFLRVLYVTPS